MKKIQFLVNVPDKYTRERYKKGQIKEFNNKRAEEILNTKRANGEPYAVLVEEKINGKKEYKNNRITYNATI